MLKLFFFLFIFFSIFVLFYFYFILLSFHLLLYFFKNLERFTKCVTAFLRSGKHANLLCIVLILVYVLPNTSDIVRFFKNGPLLANFRSFQQQFLQINC